MNRWGNMSEQQIKGKIRRKRIIYLIMGSFLIWASYNWYEQTKVAEAKAEELAQINKQLEKIKAEKANLEYKVQRLNDPEYIANLARSNYFLSKKGEIIFDIIDDSKE